MSTAAIQDLYRKVAALEKWRDDMASVEKARPIYAAYQTNAGQSIPNNAATIVDFEDVVSDPDSLVTTGAAWHFTCPIAGLYQVNATILFATSTAWALGERGLLVVHRNGSLVYIVDRKDNFTTAATSQFMQLNGPSAVICAAGDTIDVRVNQNTGGALALFNDATACFVSIHRVN